MLSLEVMKMFSGDEDFSDEITSPVGDEFVHDEGEEPCAICGGPVGVLGQLGNRLHLSCRNCGAESSRRAS